MKVVKICLIILVNSCLLLALLSIFVFFSLMKSFEDNSKYSTELKDHAKALYVQIEEVGNNE